MFPRTMSVFVAIVSCLFASASWAGDLVLADGGKSDYQIVLADNASPSTRHGAEELQTFLAANDRREAADRLRSEADGPARNHPRRQRPSAGDSA